MSKTMPSLAKTGEVFRDVNVQEFGNLLAAHMDRPCWPGLMDPAVRQRARAYARKMAIWGLIEKMLDPGAPVLFPSRPGERQGRDSRNYGEDLGSLAARTSAAATALWLEHPAADIDQFQDLLWLWCHVPTWVPTLNSRNAVELYSSESGRRLAEILHMFGDRLDAALRDCLRAEIEKRILLPAQDWQRPAWWATSHGNWNAVNNGNTIVAGLYLIRDLHQLAAFVHPLCRRLQYFIDGGFSEDGVCYEGPTYFWYGFGHYLDTALALREKTAGQINLMQGEKIANICRYPLANQIKPDLTARFEDCGSGYMDPVLALAINQFLPTPELYDICPRDRDGRVIPRPRSRAHWATRDWCLWRFFALYRGERVSGERDTLDRFLPIYGQVKLQAGRGKNAVIFIGKAGQNEGFHNHNDIGSFVLYKHGQCLLTDPGALRYTDKYFSPRRYEYLLASSRGHSAPVINGQGQGVRLISAVPLPAAEQAKRTTRRFFGSLTAQGLNQDGVKTVVVDLTNAYAIPTLKQLVRRFTFERDGTVRLSDHYAFSRAPKSLEDVLITLEPARVARGGKTVVIGSGRARLTVRAEHTAGRFKVDRLTRESQEQLGDGRAVTRVVFVPRRLDKNLTLEFIIV